MLMMVLRKQDLVFIHYIDAKMQLKTFIKFQCLGEQPVEYQLLIDEW